MTMMPTRGGRGMVPKLQEVDSVTAPTKMPVGKPRGPQHTPTSPERAGSLSPNHAETPSDITESSDNADGSSMSESSEMPVGKPQGLQHTPTSPERAGSLSPNDAETPSDITETSDDSDVTYTSESSEMPVGKPQGLQLTPTSPERGSLSPNDAETPSDITETSDDADVTSMSESSEMPIGKPRGLQHTPTSPERAGSLSPNHDVTPSDITESSDNADVSSLSESSRVSFGRRRRRRPVRRHAENDMHPSKLVPHPSKLVPHPSKLVPVKPTHDTDTLSDPEAVSEKIKISAGMQRRRQRSQMQHALYPMEQVFPPNKPPFSPSLEILSRGGYEQTRYILINNKPSVPIMNQGKTSISSSHLDVCPMVNIPPDSRFEKTLNHITLHGRVSSDSLKTGSEGQIEFSMLTIERRDCGQSSIQCMKHHVIQIFEPLLKGKVVELLQLHMLVHVIGRISYEDSNLDKETESNGHQTVIVAHSVEFQDANVLKLLFHLTDDDFPNFHTELNRVELIGRVVTEPIVTLSDDRVEFSLRTFSTDILDQGKRIQVITWHRIHVYNTFAKSFLLSRLRIHHRILVLGVIVYPLKGQEDVETGTTVTAENIIILDQFRN